MNEAREIFWADYYEELSQRSEPWLDYSNDKVQAQTFGVVLSALGPAVGRRCLDVGCGFGQLARALDAIGAAHVTGIDVTPQFIERLRQRHPSLRWEVGTLDNAELCGRLGSFDLISLVEVLQYTPVEATLRQAWSMLSPGGRLVAVVPNRDCPIVGRATARFPGNYLPPTAAELASVGGGLEGSDGWGMQGMFFAQDQTLNPYAVSDWTRAPGFPTPPNRLAFLARKACGPASSECPSQ